MKICPSAVTAAEWYVPAAIDLMIGEVLTFFLENLVEEGFEGEVVGIRSSVVEELNLADSFSSLQSK